MEHHLRRLNSHEYLDAELRAIAEKVVQKDSGQLNKEEEKALLRKLSSHVAYKDAIEAQVKNLKEENNRRKVA